MNDAKETTVNSLVCGMKVSLVRKFLPSTTLHFFHFHTIMRFILLTIIGLVGFSGTVHAQSTSFSQKPFTDVSVNSTDYQAIEYLRTQNVVKGYTDGTFRPDAVITRAEFIEFIINPFILDTNGMGNCMEANVARASKNVFYSDVSKDAWYAENICFAHMNQIVDGYPDGRFRPENSISFVEAAKVISNVFSINIDKIQTGQYWYRPYVQSLSDLHAIPTNVRRLNQTLSRADMAQIVYRLKVDSTQKANMGFNQSNNSLYMRAAVSPVVTTPKKTAYNTYSRPSRRSIVKTAESRNMHRFNN